MASFLFQASLAVSGLVGSALGSALSIRGHDRPGHGNCPPFNNGTFEIHQWQLYPDMARFDFHTCLLYISSLFNGTLVTYDPYAATTISITSFPGISDVYDEHASGIHLSPTTGILSLVIDAQPAFLTGGANTSGDYWLIKYSTRSRRELWRANLTSATDAKWSGFQDVAVDRRGNSYVIGTYPSSILRVDASGHELFPWVPPATPNTTVHGYTGVASLPDRDLLLVVDSNNVPEELSEGDSLLWRFDMRDAVGRPERIRVLPEGTKLGVPDAIHLPERYGGG